MIINNVDEGNGPLYVMEKIHAGVLKSFINQKCKNGREVKFQLVNLIKFLLMKRSSN